MTHLEHNLTAAEVRAVLIYEPETGTLRRRVRAGHQMPGAIAGSIGKNGYRYITIRRRKYLAHRLVWLYVHGEWPLGDLDHKTLNRTDNRHTELRPATRTQNMHNLRKHRDNTSGFKGVSWDSERQCWRATIQIDGRWKQLGRFADAAAAHAAYAEAACQHFGDFARTV